MGLSRSGEDRASRLSYTKALTSTLFPHSMHSKYSFRSPADRMTWRVLVLHTTQLPSTVSDPFLVPLAATAARQAVSHR